MCLRNAVELIVVVAGAGEDRDVVGNAAGRQRGPGFYAFIVIKVENEEAGISI